MANDRKNPQNIKRPPQLDNLAPPKAKPSKPEPHKRNLSPLPEIKTIPHQTLSTPYDRNRAVPPATGAERNPSHNRGNSARSKRRMLPVTGERLSRSVKPPRRQERPRPKRGMSPGVRRALNIGVTIVIIGTLLTMVGLRLFGNNALAVFRDGVHVGYIPMNNETTSASFHNEVVGHLESNHQTEIILSQQITVEPTRWVSGRNITDRASMISQLGIHAQYQLSVRAIYINNELEVFVRSDACIAEIERRITDEWRNENTVDSYFDTDWNIRNYVVDRDDERILTPLEAIAVLDRTEIVIYPYTVQSGDSLWLLAPRFGTTVENIANLNNITQDAGLNIGQTLYIRTRRPMLSVITIDETATYDIIDMLVETIYTNERYESVTYVVQEGMPGERRTIERTTRLNGTAISTEVLDSEIVHPPITRIVEVGTRPAVLERR